MILLHKVKANAIVDRSRELWLHLGDWGNQKLWSGQDLDGNGKKETKASRGRRGCESHEGSWQMTY